MRFFITIIILLTGIFLPVSRITAMASWFYEPVISGDVDFAEPNDMGDTIYYYYESYEGDIASTNVYIGEMANTTTPFKTDSLVIPANVIHNRKEHVVVGMVPNAFFNIPPQVTSLTLPQTFKSFGESTTIGVAYSSFINIYVDDNNPYFKSKDGILYDKKCKMLVAYPPMRTDSLVVIDEGIEMLCKNAFCCSTMRKVIILPNTLKTIGDRVFFNLSSLEELVLKDSIESIGAGAFSRTLHKLTMGNRVREVHYSFVNRGNNTNPDSIKVFCYTLEPPKVIFSESVSDKTKFMNSENIHLYVPRKALNAYVNADVWKSCAHILPIEPPIVTGVDTAEISWVQNFSATGYIWTLYLDEAKTQRFMSLTFDANGHLTNIDIATNPMSRQTPALYNDDGNEEQRFAEYYSFTISGLTAETTYYYTRQTLNGTDVIDEESGSFQTLSNELMVINHITENKASQKIFKNGQIYILNKDRKYTLNGACITK